MASIPTILVTFVTVSLLFRYFLFPLLFARLTQFRLSYFSIFSARGLEYRPRGQSGAVVPTLRVERLGWAWGGLCDDDVGLLVIRVEGVSLRVKRSSEDNDKQVPDRAPPGRIAHWKSRFLSSSLHLFIHHWPSVARLISVQVSDIRVIFDDLDGLELTVRDFRLGVNVNFEGDVEAPYTPTPSATSKTFRRDNPLLSPIESPPGSPFSSFSPFAYPSLAETFPEAGPRLSRIAHARKRASHIHSRMSSTASQIWSRAIARAHGSVNFSASIHDITVILPHVNPARPISARPSNVELNVPLSHRASNKSLKSEPPASPRSFASVGSLHSLLKGTVPRYALPTPEGGFERLLVVNGRSRALFGLGFGPKKGLLGEDTLRTTLDMSKLQTSLGAVEKVQELLKARKMDKKPVNQKDRWSPRALPRILLRAFESVSVSFTHLTFSHFLPTSDSVPPSASSSSTNISDLSFVHREMFTVSLETSELACRLSAADSSTNQRARNAFGTNPSPESKVRGIGFELGWNSIALQCIAPGETSEEKSQLIQMRTAEFEGLSTWRPKGWSREEMLFASDPNLALLLGRGSIASIDVAGDVQLLDELNEAWQKVRPSKPAVQLQKPSSPLALPPRIRVVLDVGHAMTLLADRVSDHKTTLTLASDGLHLGCFTSYSDVVARRRDKTAHKSAFRKEEELRQRREEACDADYAQPPAMLKPALRRQFSAAPAQLQDDYAISLRGDVSFALEPISLHMTLSGENDRDQKTYHLASIGRAHGTLTGDMLGRQEMQANGTEVSTLDPAALSCAVDLGIDSGIKVNLWDMPVIDALVTMAQAHMPAPEPIKPESKSLLCRLPSGMSARVSFGLISVFIGHEDPNPHCKLKLTRGLWFQTAALWEYAYYNRKSQAMQCRTSLDAATRAKLRLPSDITTQALAFFNSLSSKNGRAALVSLTLVDTFIKPIFDGKRFAAAGGTNMSHEHPETPHERPNDDFVGWEFRRPQARSRLSKGRFSNNVPPLEISDTDQARRPLIRIPQATINWLVQRANAETKVEHRVTGRVGDIDIVGDLSHVYSSLLAILTVKRILAAVKQSRPPSQPKLPLKLSIEIAIPLVRAHFAFPLREQLYVAFSGLSISKSSFGGIGGTATSVLVYVPSVRETGSWSELGRIKKLEVKSAPPGEKLAFDISAEAMRIRIPVAYVLSKLVLNINVTIKALKLLVIDLGGSGFSFVRRPGAEPPKRLPRISFNIEHMALEAKDDPIETNLNLIWRAGMVEQDIRNSLEDTFEAKIRVVQQARAEAAMGEDHDPSGNHGFEKLTGNIGTTFEDARHRLDWWKSRSWVRRIRAAKQEQRRREAHALKPLRQAGMGLDLPITVAESAYAAPLFRAELIGVKFSVEDVGWSREEIIKYMGEVSSPFEEDVEFSLMVPLNLSWEMDQATISLRDYPLPLVRVPPVGGDGRPAWKVETPFMIAEELAGDDSTILIPCEVIPAGCGAAEAAPFTVQIAKTIMAVKTYARPDIQIGSQRTTEFTWGNSYQPAIQDFMKVVETLSHPPRDPSARVGFWDKFRLILHWKVTVNFTGNVHLHLKGTYDPYSVTGFGAGFAMSWKGGTRLEINQPNKQYETIQITAQELLIAIPDLTALQDGAAIGNDAQVHPPSGDETTRAEQSLIERRYTKPCARFQNGVRVGFGFVLERACRPWNCRENCGGTENLLHRQCRVFDFRKHQQVVLRSAEALERDEERLGRPVDSFEGFRSDWIHFSVSVVAPLDEFAKGDDQDADKHNSLHFSPKAFAHFFAWWKLFDHVMSLPIRQGQLFPDSPPPSKKFGRSLGTIKYRFDLAPVYVSHVYQQVSNDLWSAGKSQSLGIKARFDRFRADAHQRAQEKTVRHEKLQRTNVVVHKPFYAADLLLDGIELKGIRADFVETSQSESTHTSSFPKASALPKDQKSWFNFFDFIDANRKPLDRDPEVELVNVMDCPQVFFSKRVKARQTTASDDDNSSLNSESDSRLDIESSKFGHEKSHICYLGAAAGVGPTQVKLIKARIKELQNRAEALKEDPHSRQDIANRLKTLHQHLDDVSRKERRHIDDDTFESAESSHPAESSYNHQGEMTFENTCHIHSPRLSFNNRSRNILYKYWYSNRDREREEYTTSHASLRGVRDGIQRRLHRVHNGLNQDDFSEIKQPAEQAAQMVLDSLTKILQDPKAKERFKLPVNLDSDHDDMHKPSLGLPADCIVKPHNRFLILKPQIALRSEADENAIVLLAVEEVSHKGFKVLDEIASDAIAADVLTRNYVSVKNLHGFYPTAETMQRERGPLGVPRGLDFLPLEIFVDVRSEATDYDRIVLKTNAALSLDRFNHLRMPRGLDWPAAAEDGQEIKHLRLHQDLTTVIVERLTVSATSKHYLALYNIVTDLLLYHDPKHRQRSERIDSFIFAFDRQDRDPQKLIMELYSLQHSIRSLNAIQRGYEANVDLLTDEGKSELFKIRTDLLEATEQLFTVFEAIAVNQARDDARAALKTAARMDVRVHGIAWHMLLDDMKPLIKLDIDSTLYSSVSNKDGSNDHAIVFGNVSALNSGVDPLYPEMLVRYDPSGSRDRSERLPFASAFWSFMAPVGGITIVRHFAFDIHPVRFRLEEKVGHEVMDYIFSDRKRRRAAKIANGSAKVDTKELGFSIGFPHGDKQGGNSRANSTADLTSLSGSKSQVSLVSQNTENMGQGDDKFTMVPTKDAAEMRRRASVNKTFVKVVFGATSLVLSYKTDDNRKHPTFSIPDCVDFKIKTPAMTYANKVWGYEDIFEHVKRDVRSYAWSQGGDIISQLIKKTSVFRSKKGLKHVATASADLASRKTSKSHAQSHLRQHIEAPIEEEVSHTLSLARKASKEVVTSPTSLSQSSTRRSGSENVPQILGVPLPEAQDGASGDEEDDEVEKEHGVGKAVKGLFGKFRKHTASSHGSGDELSRVVSSDRSRRGTPSHSSSPSTSHPPSRDHTQLCS